MRLPYMTYFDNLILDQPPREAISNPSATTVEHVLRDHMCQGQGWVNQPRFHVSVVIVLKLVLFSDSTCMERGFCCGSGNKTTPKSNSGEVRHWVSCEEFASSGLVRCYEYSCGYLLNSVCHWLQNASLQPHQAPTFLSLASNDGRTSHIPPTCVSRFSEVPVNHKL